MYAGPQVHRDDASIDFDWGQRAPFEGLPADAFSVHPTPFRVQGLP